MRIAIISPGSFSVPPVIGTSVEHVIQMVAQHLKKENEVIVYTKKCPEYERSSSDGNLFYKRIRYRNPKFYMNRVIRHLHRNRPDAIVIENRPSYVLAAKEALPGVPIILNMHSDVFSLRSHIKRDSMIEVSVKVDSLITNSRSLEQYFIRNFPAFNGKSNAVHLGIDVTSYEEAMKDQDTISRVREKYRVMKDDLTLLFAGRLLKKKGLHLLLKIMPQLIRKYPHVKLIITGSPRYGKNINTNYTRTMRERVAEISDNVVLTDFIEPHEMPIIYQLADIVVTPSIWNEPFLLVNLEAMASRKPVVTSNKGGITEVVVHGETGLVFSVDKYKKELYESICLLLDSRPLRENLGVNGWELAKGFTWERTASHYLKIIKDLVKPSGH